MTELKKRILPTVQKPARYTGGEWGEIKKNLDEIRVRVAFCFPDTYEIGMSNVGMRILYGVMNEMEGVWCERVFAPWADMVRVRVAFCFPDTYEIGMSNVGMRILYGVMNEMEGVWCERVFAPWADMEQAMRQNNLPLWALESQDPVQEFDMIAFTIGYEMAYSNVLNMLNLAGVPLHARDRQGLKNIVFAGGVCTFNPEPLAEFVDFFSLGEGEESSVEIVSLYDRAKAQGWTKDQFLREVAKIPGVYVPSFYEHQYNPDGTLAAILPQEGAPETVTKRIVQDLDKVYFPTQMIVPSTEIVHDRANLEVFRGCIRGCRFCQAGFSCRPVRKKSTQVLYSQAVDTLEHSGCNEITISSLSTSDYRGLKELTDELIPYCADRKINLSHDRANLEVFRGCIRGCRFCQAGFSCRPVRKKSPQVLYRQAVETLEHSGFNEITISSLSTSDYRGLKELTDELIPYCADRKINLSVPSLRADNFSRELMEKLQAVRKTGLTFAPS